MTRSNRRRPATRDVPPRVPFRDVRNASPSASVCPFLRRRLDGELEAPIETPDESNVCAALEEPLAQSARQQELVCLVAAHVDCPRYLRGVLVSPSAAAEPGRRPPVSPAVAASLAVLLLSAIVSVGYVAAAGGLSVRLAADVAASANPSDGVVAGAPSGPPASTPPPTPDATPSATPASSPTLEPSRTPGPSASPAPTPAPTSRPSVAPTPRATSDRFAVLTACAGRTDCWVYVIRSGDNLFSIAHWFGVPIDSVYRMNPWARTTPLRAGQQLRIPTPTR